METGIERGIPWYKATCFLVVEMKLLVLMCHQLKKTVLPPAQDMNIH